MIAVSIGDQTSLFSIGDSSLLYSSVLGGTTGGWSAKHSMSNERDSSGTDKVSVRKIKDIRKENILAIVLGLCLFTPVLLVFHRLHSCLWKLSSVSPEDAPFKCPSTGPRGLKSSLRCLKSLNQTFSDVSKVSIRLFQMSQKSQSENSDFFQTLTGTIFYLQSQI